LEAQLDYMAIALGVPKRVFMGSEQGELASSQDSKSWGKRVIKRQNEYLTPMLIRPFIDRLIAMGVALDMGLTVGTPLRATMNTPPGLSASMVKDTLKGRGLDPVHLTDVSPVDIAMDSTGGDIVGDIHLTWDGPVVALMPLCRAMRTPLHCRLGDLYQTTGIPFS
jgi:hypothetical protein